MLGYPLTKLRGTSGVLAQQNAMRNPRRTARTASSLMIGVGLVAFIMIFAASAKTSMAGSMAKDYHGTHIVDSGAFDSSAGFSPELATTLRTTNGVRLVSEQRITKAALDGSMTDMLMAFEPAEIGQLFDLGTITGSLDQLGSDGMAVEAKEATAHGWALGDTVTVTFPNGTKPFTVKAIYDNGVEWVGPEFVGIDGFAGNIPTALDARLYVATDDPAALSAAAADYPSAKVLDKQGFLDEKNAQMDMMLKLMYAMLTLAVVIALLGIANTLALSIFERKRELGLLRAVGMSRAQVRSSVRWEAVIIALFGTALGLAIGVFFGWATVGALSDQGVDTLTIPPTGLLVVTLGGAFAGVAAAIVPARRAARLDVLKAVATG
jgi:putative ABC transport system permease protein